MIINVKKYLLIGAKEEVGSFFPLAQQQGIIEFIPHTGQKTVEVPIEVNHLIKAIKVLRKLPVKKTDLQEEDPNRAVEVAERIVNLKVEVEKLSEERRLLEAEIARVAPLGDFSIEDIDFIEKESRSQIQFFCRKTGKNYPIDGMDGLFYIGTEYDLDYFFSVDLGQGIKNHSEMIEMRIDRPIGELKTHFTFLNESLYQLEAELKGFAGHIEYLHEALLIHLNEHHLNIAKKGVAFPLKDTLFAIEAWVPANKTQLLCSLIDGMAIHCEPIAIDTDERVPTYMENQGNARIGEDLVRIYDAPSSKDKDPSGWVFWFFALFFAMIVADGGYGFLYLGIALYIKYKYPDLKGAGKRFLKLAFVLSTACVIWGVATASFFGIDIHPKTWVSQISLIQNLAIKKAQYHIDAQDEVYHQWVHLYPNLSGISDGEELLNAAVTHRPNKDVYEILNVCLDNLLMEFSLIIGVIHVAFALLRYLFRNWAGIGWIAFMIGGYLYFPETLNATSVFHFLGLIDNQTGRELGLQLLYSGMGSALVLALIQRGWSGLHEIANMVQVFADVLSYLRLYALGLAGAIMASTFNEMGQEIGLLFGWIVILCGHSINILLGLMAGVIHGLRLNFIEWYHYCFDGGGRFFNPLMKLRHDS